MIVDTHVHVVSQDTARYPIQPGGIHLDWVYKRPVTAEQLIGGMKEGGVGRAVLVQAKSAHGYDNSYVADTAALHRDLFSSVCSVNVSKPDAPDRLSYWIEERRMEGLRIFNGASRDDPWLDDPRSLAVLERAKQLKVPVTMVSRHLEIEHVRNALERFPDMPLALDHLARLPSDERPPYENSEEFFALAEYPNLSLKFSAVNQWAAAKGPVPPREYFKEIVDRFGAKRLMWGSNYPPTSFRPYPELARMAWDLLDFLPDEHRRWIMGENALRHWPAPKGR